jgi:hypothetical protein
VHDVEGSDQRGSSRGGARRRELRDKPPGPGPSTHLILPVPQDWPEAITWAAGWRLAEAEEDTVPELIRLGSDVTAYLEPAEIAAMLELGDRAHARWLSLGWNAWVEVNEGG